MCQGVGYVHSSSARMMPRIVTRMAAVFVTVGMVMGGGLSGWCRM